MGVDCFRPGVAGRQTGKQSFNVLRALKVAEGAGKEVCGIRRWAPDVQGRCNHNKAPCALANKLARICYATLRDHAPFDEAARLTKKQSRQSFVMPA